MAIFMGSRAYRWRPSTHPTSPFAAEPGVLMESILARSKATEAFKQDVLRFASGDEPAAIQILGYAPRVKVERVLVQLLSAEPDLAVRSAKVRGASGCSDFTGEIIVETPTATRTFSFVWCCRWRAEQEGWKDYFGFPDQIRAAREFGWDCFQRWSEKGSGLIDAAPVSERLEGLIS